MIKNKTVDVSMLNKKPVWRYEDVAAYFDVSESSVRQWVMNKKIPFFKIEKCVRFDPTVLMDWFKNRRRVE